MRVREGVGVAVPEVLAVSICDSHATLPTAGATAVTCVPPRRAEGYTVPSHAVPKRYEYCQAKMPPVQPRSVWAFATQSRKFDDEIHPLPASLEASGLPAMITGRGTPAALISATDVLAAQHPEEEDSRKRPL